MISSAYRGSPVIPTGDRRPLPPFGKYIGVFDPPSVLILSSSMAEAWDRAKDHLGRVIVLPIDRPASEFRWPVVGRRCVVVDTNLDAAQISELFAELIAAGAAFVVSVPEGHLVYRSEIIVGTLESDESFEQWREQLGRFLLDGNVPG